MKVHNILRLLLGAAVSVTFTMCSLSTTDSLYKGVDMTHYEEIEKAIAEKEVIDPAGNRAIT